MSGPTPGPNDIRVGFNGAVGNVDHVAETLHAQSWVFIGVDGGQGTYNLSGNARLSQGADFEQRLYIGFGSNEDGHNSLGELNIGTGHDSPSVLANALHIGSEGATGVVNQTSGTHDVNKWAVVGASTDSFGEYNLSGGTLNQNENWLTVGEKGSGTLTVSGQSRVNANDLGIIVGRNDTGVGKLSIVGGQNSVHSSGDLRLGVDGNNNQTDATASLDFVSQPDVSAIMIDGDVALNTGKANLTVDFVTSAPPPGDILLIDIGGTRLGEFAGLPEGTVVPNSGNRTITYVFGDGNDIGLLSTVLIGDFNNNDILDDEDIDLLSVAIRTATNNVEFNLDGDADINEQDRAVWVQDLAKTFFGDADLDGDVEFSDFVRLANGFGSDGGWADGDFDGDGTVAFADFVIVANNFGMSTSLANVPEPEIMPWGLLSLAAVALLRRRV